MQTHVGSAPAQLQEWEKQQRELAACVVASDDADWMQADRGGWGAGLRLVGGLDISFFPDPHTQPSSGAGAACTDNGKRSSSHSSSSSSHSSAGFAPTPTCSTAASCATEPDSPEGAPGEGLSLPPTTGRAVAALAVLSFPLLQLCHMECLEVGLDVPYLPGYLGFREVPAFVELLQRAAAKGIHPQLLLVDGYGVLHPRRCGSASHLGVLTGLPTVGVAKSLLRVDGLPPEKHVQAAAAAAASPASATASAGAATGASGNAACAVNALSNSCSNTPWVPLVGAGGEVLGAAVCPSPAKPTTSSTSSQRVATMGSSSGGQGRAGSSGSKLCISPLQPPARPPLRAIYVSVGHKVALATAVDIVQRCCLHRVPEPIRQADLHSRAEVRRQLQQPP